MSQSKDVYEELRKVAKIFGIEKLATHMGVATGTLYNKLNLSERSLHKVTLSDFIHIMTVTKDPTPLQSLCALFSGVFYPLPDFSTYPNEALLEIINRVQIKNGAAHGVMHSALKDAIVTAEETRAFEKECQEWLAAILELRARFIGLCTYVKR